jgi:hypothetical protein
MCISRCSNEIFAPSYELVSAFIFRFVRFEAVGHDLQKGGHILNRYQCIPCFNLYKNDCMHQERGEWQEVQS